MGGCRPAILLSLLVCTGLRSSEAFELRRGLRRSSPGLVTWKVVSRAIAKRKSGKSEEKRPEKQPFKIAWPWRKRPKPQPKPLDLLRLELSRMRQRVAGLCQRCSDSARRLHQAGVMWWFAPESYHIEKGVPMRFFFLLSNAAYLLSGFALLERTVSRGCPPLLGYLMMAACGYSTTYHAMQILFGVSSEAAKSTGRLDVGLAGLSAVYFFIECGCGTLYMRSLALVSGMMFVDVFQLGYTISHSLWHLGGAALAFQGGSEWTRRRRKIKWLPGAGPAPVRLVPVRPPRSTPRLPRPRAISSRAAQNLPRISSRRAGRDARPPPRRSSSSGSSDSQAPSRLRLRAA